MKFNFVILTFCLTCNLNFGITQNVPDLDRDLFEAAKEGNETAVEFLIEKGANVSTIDRKPNRLISPGQRQWRLDGSHETPLHVAAEKGFEKIVEILIRNGANINAKSVDWSTPLHFAAIGGNEKIVELLIQNGADMHAKSYPSLEYTPLHYAASRGNKKAASVLIQYGANINALDFRSLTPLQAAIRGDNDDQTVELLIQNGADVNAREFENRTLLHLAAMYGNEKTVQLLIRNGFDVNARDDGNFTPIYYAVKEGHEKNVKLLIENGADASIRGSENKTLLHFAALNGGEKVADVLIQMGANVSARDDEHFTPLHSAALQGKEKVADVLIRNGADVGATDLDNRTPLHLAAWKGHTNTAELLIQKGANINARTELDSTPLHLAAWNDQETTTELLIRNGAEINAKDKDNNTPLHLAAEKGFYGTVNLLLQRKPNIQIKNNDGKTAIDIANSKSLYKIADAIEGDGSIAKRACRIYSNVLKTQILDEGEETTIIFPWMAALGYLNEDYNISFECAGTIISDEFILTAAHCVQPRRPSVVRLGKLSLSDDDGTITENRQYKEIITHPNYVASEMKNDIALIQLTERVWLTESIMPACLQTNQTDESPDVRLAVTGWGIGLPVWPKSEVLRKIEMVTMPLSKCNMTILMNNRADRNLSAFGNGVDQSHYCAYDPESKVGSCQSNGELLQIVPNDLELAKVIGIGSLGITCDAQLPSIYTRIAHYIGWIESKVWPNGEITVRQRDGDY